MILVLDASAFFCDFVPAGPAFVPPAVVDELRDATSRLRFEYLQGRGLEVRDPTNASRALMKAEAEASGDAGVLSEADIDLLALARDLSASIVTDDFAIQNVALRLGIATQQLQQRSARRIRWRFRCTGCGRYHPKGGDCPICGAPMKRTMK